MAHPTRLLFIDGLRGIAAMLVTIFHIAANLPGLAPPWLPSWLSAIASRGYLGVDIFFVISGFVIALTIGRHRVTAAFAARFALRRIVRLDPPYWVSIACAIAMAMLAQRLFPDLQKTLPSVADVVAHLFYAQNLLGRGDIVPVYWSLCLEVQFYLLLLVLCAVGARVVSSGPEPAPGAPAFQAFILASTLISLAVFTDVISIPLPGTFLPYWFLFTLGAACAWVHLGWISIRWLFGYLAAYAAFALINPQHVDALIAGLATAASIVTASRFSRMHAWLSSTPFQYLGRISYSLYLFHALIGWSAVSVAKRFLDMQHHPSLSIAAFGIGIAASVMAAHVAYLVIEAPSVRLSRRIRYESAPRAQAAVPLRTGSIERENSVLPP